MKTYVVYTFIDKDELIRFRTYTLECFKNTIDDFLKNGRPALNNPNFVDNNNKNILDFVSQLVYKI